MMSARRGASAGPRTGPHDIAFLFLGGLHQAMHIAPVAIAFVRRGDRVSAYVPPADAEGLVALLAEIDPGAAPSIAVVPLAPRLPSRLIGALFGARSKVATLIEWRRRLSRHDALVVAERTSTLLKRWPGRRPFMVYTPHGAGDRGVSFEPRVGLFDLVLAAGTHRLERLVDTGVMRPERCAVVGSIKLSAVVAMDKPLPRLFADDRPIVFYNPHFDTMLSSWSMARAIAEAVVADGRFNLIVAPHVRLSAALDVEERDAWRRFGERDGVVVDLGSPRAIDMTYTRAADIYLGDVSSQVYEFLYRPRPAVFVDAHAAAWRDNPDYAMWALGEVVDDSSAVVAALGRAAARHGDFRAAQEAFVAARLGPVDAGVPDRAADAIVARLHSGCR